jgi:hypothetical protein
MNYPNQNGMSNDPEIGGPELGEPGFGEPGPAEITLRLIARLPAPQGLEDRVHAGLLAAPRGGRVLAWPASKTWAGGWMRSAAAAAIVCVIAGGGWGIYSHVQPGQTVPGIAGPRVGAPGGFSQGGAVRRPQTLVGPIVTHPATPTPPQARAPAKDSARSGPNKSGAKLMHNSQPAATSKAAPSPAVQ